MWHITTRQDLGGVLEEGGEEGMGEEALFEVIVEGFAFVSRLC